MGCSCATFTLAGKAILIGTLAYAIAVGVITRKVVPRDVKFLGYMLGSIFLIIGYFFCK